MPTATNTEAQKKFQAGHHLVKQDPESALTHLAEALTLGARNLELFHDLSGLLLHFRKYEETWKICELGKRSFPNSPDLLGNQGVALGELGQYDEALDCFSRQAQLVSKRSRRPWNNTAGILLRLGQLDEAKRHYEKAISYGADPAIHLNYATALLLNGEFKAGFQQAENRPSLKENCLPGVPFWTGGPIPSNRLFLYAEQGMGDVIQCLRYLPIVEKCGIELVLGVPPSLERLMKSLPGSYTVATSPQQVGIVGAQLSFLSLPHILGTELTSIPAPVACQIDLQQKAHWAARLGPKTRCRVALVWAGNSNHGNDHNRSVPFSMFEPILSVPDVQFVSVQMGAPVEQLRQSAFKSKILDLSSSIQDFTDTAAILSEVDLLITVDTSVAHLGGTQGMPVWNLLPFAPDWRWLLDRSDSPWYPNMRLFRQPKARDWRTVTLTVADELKQLLRSE